jgi:hypothetical protein
MENKESFLDALQKPRDGFVMRNPRNNAEITCTAKFVQHWKDRGFVIVREGEITLMRPDTDDDNSKSKK